VKELADKEALLVSNTANGDRVMTDKEIGVFKAQLREKFNTYNALKSQMRAMKAETAVLQLTEQVYL
jgi:hypothetical protein